MIYAFTKIIENLAANPFLLKTTEQLCIKVKKSKTNRMALSWASCVVFVLPIFAFASLHLELKPRNIICHELRNNFLFENDLSSYILINSSIINIIEDLNYFEDKNYFTYRHRMGVDETEFDIKNRTTVKDFNHFGYLPMCYDFIVEIGQYNKFHNTF